mmetsp:Transcript_16451/g.39048  ORF Transcript_16451/g.39048 Transcript_16451/m.39048 type:complete len:277 (+) Transcript_16451:87-917(+)
MERKTWGPALVRSSCCGSRGSRPAPTPERCRISFAGCASAIRVLAVGLVVVLVFAREVCPPQPDRPVLGAARKRFPSGRKLDAMDWTVVAPKNVNALPRRIVAEVHPHVFAACHEPVLLRAQRHCFCAPLGRIALDHRERGRVVEGDALARRDRRNGAVGGEVDGGRRGVGLEHPHGRGRAHIPHGDVVLVRARREDQRVVVAPRAAADPGGQTRHLHRRRVGLVHVKDAEDLLLAPCEHVAAVGGKLCRPHDVLVLELMELVAVERVPYPHGEVG